MKKLTFALACSSTLALLAAPLHTATFEGVAVGTTEIGGKTDTGDSVGSIYWQFAGASGATDGSTVKKYGDEGNLDAPAGDQLSGTPGDNYLDLSTEGGTLWRTVNSGATLEGETAAAPKALADTDNGFLYIDTMVQFTATEDGTPPEVGEQDKLAIWLDAPEGGAKQLCVLASAYDYVESEMTQPATKFVLTPADGSELAIEPGAWYRLSVKAVTLCQGEIMIQGFEIRVDGKLMKTTTAAPVGAGLVEALGSLFGDENLAKIAQNTLFPSLMTMGGEGDVPAITAVGFKGSGALDDVVVTEDELFAEAEPIEFTVTPPTGATDLMYAIGDGAAAALPADGKISGAPGATVTITGTLADGTAFTKTGTISENGTLDLSVVDWSFYLVADADGCYVVDSATELCDLRRGVAAGLGTAGVTFRQTADIDLAGIVWPGIGTPKSNAANAGFLGVYDGQNHLIENVTFERKQYNGLFANVGGNAQIKNLVIKVAGIAAEGGTSSYGAAACVGYAWGTGVLIENVTAAGQTDGSVLEGNHNIAGIGCRLQGAITLRNCTNNLALATTYSKIGGMCAIASSDPSGLTETADFKPAGAIVFEGCVNNAAITAKGPLVGSPTRTAGSDGVAGILAYIQSSKPISIVNCENNGTLQHTGANGTNTGAADLPAIASFIGKSSGLVWVDVGGNKAKADYLAMSQGTSTSGLNFATVADGVATFVADSAAVSGADLKVMTAGNTVTLPNIGDSITLDMSLATATVTTSVTEADYGIVKNGDVYTVTMDWSTVLGAADADGAYVIDDAAELAKFAAKAATLGTKGVTFKLGANIDMAGSGAFAGVGGLKGSSPFEGTFDGAGKTISNVTFKHDATYRGFFNSVNNATIKDLTIVVSGFDSTSAAEFGAAAFVGQSTGTVLFRNLTAKGTLGTADRPCNHSAAGILVRGVGTFENCVNEMAIVSRSDNTKVGGMVAIQNGAVALKGCSNAGALTAGKGSGAGDYVEGVGGLVGYEAGKGLTIEACSNTGVITDESNVGKASQLVGRATGTVAVSGTNTGLAGMKAIDKAVDGLCFATVAAGVATYVKDEMAVAGADLAVTAPGKTVTLANVGDSITLDMTAATAAVETSAANADVQQAGNVWTVVAAGKVYPAYIAEEDKDKYDAWVEAFSVADRVDATAALQKAYLLNVAPANAEAAEAEFVITSITVDAEGNVTVTTPEGKNYNGKVEIQGAETLAGPWAPKAAGHKFFKAILK